VWERKVLESQGIPGNKTVGEHWGQHAPEVGRRWSVPPKGGKPKRVVQGILLETGPKGDGGSKKGREKAAGGEKEKGGE